MSINWGMPKADQFSFQNQLYNNLLVASKQHTQERMARVNKADPAEWQQTKRIYWGKPMPKQLISLKQAADMAGDEGGEEEEAEDPDAAVPELPDRSTSASPKYPFTCSDAFAGSAAHLLSRLWEPHVFRNSRPTQRGFERHPISGELRVPRDKPLFVQLAGNDPDLILAAAKLVQHRCEAVDINFG